MDLFATFVDLAAANPPAGSVLDGLNLMPFLEGSSASPRRTLGFFRNVRLFALRSGRWKLHFIKMPADKRGRLMQPITCYPPELYDLENDPGESRNVAGDYPDVVAAMARVSAELRESVAAGRLPPSQWRSLLPVRRR
jgi:arylsulfatase A-like enzyme